MAPFQYNVVYAPTMMGPGLVRGGEDDEAELWGELAREVCRGCPLVLYITTVL